LGLLLILAGLSVAMNNVISFLIISLSIFFAVNYRIYVEEKVLTDEFGDIYKEYKTKTKKLIPGLY
jgi:protein-S-isoprenylcysteine O-methyltransferase Ste14